LAVDGSPVDLRPASAVYWAQLVEIRLDWFERFDRFLDALASRTLSPALVDERGNTPANPQNEPEPRYRIVVGRHDGEDSVGIKTARDRKSAERVLAEIETLLSMATVDNFAGLYELAHLR
jgi:hypothetical protein